MRGVSGFSQIFHTHTPFSGADWPAMKDRSTSGPTPLVTPAAGYQGRLQRTDEQLAAIDYLHAEADYARALEFHLQNIVTAIEGFQSTGIPAPSLERFRQAMLVLLPDHDELAQNMAYARESLDADHQYEYALLVTPPIVYRNEFLQLRSESSARLRNDLKHIRDSQPYTKAWKQFAKTVDSNMNDIMQALEHLEHEHARYAAPAIPGRSR